MAWWRRLFGRKSVSSLELFREIFGGRVSKSGRTVTYKTALEVATVLACVRVLANGVAQVPFKLFRQDGRERLEATDHPLYWVVFRKPNGWQSSFEYRQTLMLHLALCQNHFSFVNRVRGRVVELIPLEPGQVTVRRRDDWRLEYEVRATDGASKQTFPQEAIWHVRGLSWNGWMGMEAVALAREAIGLAMAIEEQQAGFFKGGAQPGGIYSVEGPLTDKQYKDLKAWIEENVEGQANAGKVLLLDRGAKFIAREFKAVDSQTIESRRYQVEEICRGIGVMPIMIGHADKTATYASAEQMFLAHVVHTLAPWYECIEQSADINLLADRELREGLYFKFIAQGLLRGALRDTATYLKELALAGIMTRNEARAKLELNPLAGLDEPLTPANITGNPARDPARDTEEEE